MTYQIHFTTFVSDETKKLFSCYLCGKNPFKRSHLKIDFPSQLAITSKISLQMQIENKRIVVKDKCI